MIKEDLDHVPRAATGKYTALTVSRVGGISSTLKSILL